ncbi:MAG: hypothetical protein L0Y58_11115 [Verrucomicrobia subdivision 3 bacterium]|nr:hypothetical protein [Limisphaerales bacterium]
MKLISRRRFLGAAGAIAGGMLTGRGVFAAQEAEGRIMTVLGPIDPKDLGLTLTHEHCVVDFLGAEKATAPRHNGDEAFQIILPHLKALRGRGCRSFVECTPKYIGRDVRLLRRLAQASGLQILTNTGYYGAAGNKFMPKHAYSESADELAARWFAEWRDGIEGTGIRPGFIKLGVEKGKLSDLHTKLLRAAARVHLKSGLAIAIHSGDGEAALDEIRVLGEERVAPSGLIWVHAQNDPGPIQIEAAKRGAWVSLDGFSEKNRGRYAKFLGSLREAKLLHRVLLSHDHFWSVEGEGERGGLKLHSGGAETAFVAVFQHLLPDLRASAFSEEEIRQLTVTNPAEAFTVRVRKL